MINTIRPEFFSANIRKALLERKEREALSRNKFIDMSESMLALIKDSAHVAKCKFQSKSSPLTPHCRLTLARPMFVQDYGCTDSVPGVKAVAVTQRNATRAPARPRTTSLTLSWTHGYSVCSFEWALVYPEESASFNGNACTHRKFDAHLDVERCPINLEH